MSITHTNTITITNTNTIITVTITITNTISTVTITVTITNTVTITVTSTVTITNTPSCLSRCVLFVAAPDLRGKLCCGVVAFRCAHGGKGFQDDDLRCLFPAGSRP